MNAPIGPPVVSRFIVETHCDRKVIGSTATNRKGSYPIHIYVRKRNEAVATTITTVARGIESMTESTLQRPQQRAILTVAILL